VKQNHTLGIFQTFVRRKSDFWAKTLNNTVQAVNTVLTQLIIKNNFLVSILEIYPHRHVVRVIPVSLNLQRYAERLFELRFQRNDRRLFCAVNIKLQPSLMLKSQSFKYNLYINIVYYVHKRSGILSTDKTKILTIVVTILSYV